MPNRFAAGPKSPTFSVHNTSARPLTAVSKTISSAGSFRTGRHKYANRTGSSTTARADRIASTSSARDQPFHSCEIGQAVPAGRRHGVAHGLRIRRSVFDPRQTPGGADRPDRLLRGDSDEKSPVLNSRQAGLSRLSAGRKAQYRRPRMNADQRRLKTNCLSAFIRGPLSFISSLLRLLPRAPGLRAALSGAPRGAWRGPRRV